MDDLVTIATFIDHVSILTLRSRLEAEGIPVFAADENTVAIDPLVSPAIGGVKVQVPASCVERALEIMAEDETPAAVAASDAWGDAPAPAPTGAAASPSDGSLRVIATFLTERAFFFLYVAMMIIALYIALKVIAARV